MISLLVQKRRGKWPQWNDEEEKKLLSALNALADKPSHEAREEIASLEGTHGARRALVWAELDESVLAQALKPLSVLAEITTETMAAGSIEDIFDSYTALGWKADDAVLEALSYADDVKAYEAISAAVRSMYLPWAQDNARYLQKVVNANGYPGETIETASTLSYQEGECILFVDGLRFDTAKRLVSLLESKGVKAYGKTLLESTPKCDCYRETLCITCKA